MPTDLLETQEATEEGLNLVKHILSQFNEITEERVHALAFLTEYQYRADDRGTGRITDSKYYVTLYSDKKDGVHSKNIMLAFEEIVDSLENITKYSKRVSGTKFETYVIKDSFETMDGAEGKICDQIIEEFGDDPNLMDVYNEMEEYRTTKLGEEIRF